MNRRVAVPPCRAAILSVIRTCLSLLLRVGRKRRNVLGRKPFQPSQKSHFPCFRENLPASREWWGRRRARNSRRQRSSSETCEPRNGIGFARDGVQFHKPGRSDLKTNALLKNASAGGRGGIRNSNYAIEPVPGGPARAGRLARSEQEEYVF